MGVRRFCHQIIALTPAVTSFHFLPTLTVKSTDKSVSANTGKWGHKLSPNSTSFQQSSSPGVAIRKMKMCTNPVHYIHPILYVTNMGVIEEVLFNNVYYCFYSCSKENGENSQFQLILLQCPYRQIVSR